MIRKQIIYFTLLIPVLFFSQKKDSLKPGTTTSISFTIENRTSEAKNYDLTAESSNPSIAPILKTGSISIASNENKIYIVPLKIAVEAPQGKYSVFLTGIDNSTKEKFTLTSEFIVAESREISLTTLDYPEFVKAGEKIKSTFILKNNGNISENLILESKNAVIDHPEKILLQPGESK
ncbi:hypothetical protein [Chryseobacterium sp. 2R14A]|uniref:COG1470 family protein n=1 Tax=Chryseobacterium sp. 2R14A TaxID=3380353 RepID=UPI003CEEAF42